MVSVMTFLYIYKIYLSVSATTTPHYVFLTPPTSTDHLSLPMSAPFLFYVHIWFLFCLCFS